MARRKHAAAPLDEPAANDDAQEAALWREFTELGNQIASLKTNWENQAEVDNAKRLLDRHKAVAQLLHRPPTPADPIGEFFSEASQTLSFVDIRYDEPPLLCARSDPEYPAELARQEEYRRKVDDHLRKASRLLTLLHEDADRLADTLASIGEDTRQVLEFMQTIPCGPGCAFCFDSAPARAKLRELWPWLENIRRRLVAEAAKDVAKNEPAAAQADPEKEGRNMPTSGGLIGAEGKAQALQVIIEGLKEAREDVRACVLLQNALQEKFLKALRWGAFAGPRWADLTYRNPTEPHFAQVLSYAKRKGFVNWRSEEGTYKGVFDEAAGQLIELLGQEAALEADPAAAGKGADAASSPEPETRGSFADVVRWFNVPEKLQPALRGRLYRWRKNRRDGWTEAKTKNPNEPSILYVYGSVQSICQEFLASNARATKKS